MQRRSSTIRHADIAAMLRLMGELGELPNDPAVRAPFLMSRLCRLVDAQWGIITMMRTYLPGKVPALYHSFQGGELDARLRSAFFDYVNFEGGKDPMVEAMGLMQPQATVRRRPEVVPDRRWYDSMHVKEFRRKAYLDESIYAIYPFDREGNAIGIGLTRPAGANPYSERERRIIEFMNDGLTWFYHRFRESGNQRSCPQLPPALHRTLKFLLEGLSEKQIAHFTKLSPHTIHGLVKSIYRRFEVSSRAGLCARLIRNWDNGRTADSSSDVA
jgi:DNA-binding CsgD family transcriptional regulator